MIFLAFFESDDFDGGDRSPFAPDFDLGPPTSIHLPPSYSPRNPTEQENLHTKTNRVMNNKMKPEWMRVMHETLLTMPKITKDEQVVLAILEEYDVLHKAYMIVVQDGLDQRMVQYEFDREC